MHFILSVTAAAALLPLSHIGLASAQSVDSAVFFSEPYWKGTWQRVEPDGNCADLKPELVDNILSVFLKPGSSTSCQIFKMTECRQLAASIPPNDPPFGETQSVKCTTHARMLKQANEVGFL